MDARARAHARAPCARARMRIWAQRFLATVLERLAEADAAAYAAEKEKAAASTVMPRLASMDDGQGPETKAVLEEPVARHVYGHVRGHVCGYAHGNLHSHVNGHANGHVYRHVYRHVCRHTMYATYHCARWRQAEVDTALLAKVCTCPQMSMHMPIRTSTHASTHPALHMSMNTRMHTRYTHVCAAHMPVQVSISIERCRAAIG